MAAIIQRWKKVIAVGCSHGELANKNIQQQVLDFCDDYKPQIRFDLGDVVDTAAFRAGARGTPDEARKAEPDEFAAISWLERYRPTHLTWGNHCWRLMDLQNSPNAIVSYAASSLWTKLTDATRRLKTQTREYDIEKNWFEMGGHYWGHGFFWNENALRDHAEYLGGPVVMAHLHRPEQSQGRNLRWATSYCVGCLADVPSMHYARRRRATSRWGHGAVVGEISDKSAHLWLVSCAPGGKLIFPM